MKRNVNFGSSFHKQTRTDRQATRKKESKVCWVTFLVVQNFSAVVVADLLGREGTIGHLTVNTLVVLAIVSEDTQEGRATSTGTTENQDHLTVLAETVHGVENGAGDGLGGSLGLGECLLGPEVRVDEVGETDEGITKVLDVLGSDTLTGDLEVLPGNTEVAALDTSVLGTGDDVLEVVGQIEIHAVVGSLFAGLGAIEGRTTGELALELLEVLLSADDVDARGAFTPTTADGILVGAGLGSGVLIIVVVDLGLFVVEGDDGVVWLLVSGCVAQDTCGWLGFRCTRSVFTWVGHGEIGCSMYKGGDKIRCVCVCGCVWETGVEGEGGRCVRCA